MVLTVRFVDDNQPQLVAKLVERVGVRAVGATHSVEVVLLQQHEVCTDLIIWNGFPVLWMHLHAVHAIYEKRCSIEQQNPAPDPDIAYAETPPLDLQRFSVGALEFHHQCVEVWPLRRPLRRFSDACAGSPDEALPKYHVQMTLRGSNARTNRLGDNVRPVQHCALNCRPIVTTQGDVDRNFGVGGFPIWGVDCTGDAEILNRVLLRHRVEHYVAEDAAEPPCILVFEV
mmetsp:Transcript_105109/g.296004  ORF Transcript_105109/g.296004 Transcript_105109/m.296004 type:complete len:229 (+) Transcript_105109:2195-2881(+)